MFTFSSNHHHFRHTNTHLNHKPKAHFTHRHTLRNNNQKKKVQSMDTRGTENQHLNNEYEYKFNDKISLN